MSAQLNLDGTVLPGCPSCGEVVPEMEAMRVYVEGLEKELRVKRAQISRLRAEQAASDKSDPHYEQALEVYGLWKRELAPRSREFSAASRKVVFARLKAGWTLEELKQAVTGYAGCPYVVDGKRARRGHRSQRYADLELICRDDKHVRQGIELWEQDREERIKNAMPQDVITPEALGAGVLPPHDLDAEGALLGSIVLAGASAAELVRKLREEEGLESEHFYRPTYQQIFQAMTEMEGPIDEVLLAAHMKADTGVETVIKSLTSSVVSLGNWRHYAQIIVRLWRYRALLGLGREMVTAALDQDGGRLSELVGRAESLREAA